MQKMELVDLKNLFKTEISVLLLTFDFILVFDYINTKSDTFFANLKQEKNCQS